MIKRRPFDAVAVEASMAETGVLAKRGDADIGPLGRDLERFFTEYGDPRKYALWRISMVRQFQSSVLRRLSRDDLLFLAGQTPEGYPSEVAPGINFNRNKVMQNAERARVELDTRARRGAWWRSVALVFVGAGLGVLLPWIADKL